MERVGRTTRAQFLERGIDIDRIPRKVSVKFRIAMHTRIKIKSLAYFMDLDTSSVIDMAMEALLAHINQRYLAAGGAEADLLKWNSSLINNDDFYKKLIFAKRGKGKKNGMAKPLDDACTASDQQTDRGAGVSSNEAGDPGFSGSEVSSRSPAAHQDAGGIKAPGSRRKKHKP
jgi:hypothetical protein